MWTFVKSSSNKTNWLQGHAKEVCFIGRSNVGKSSLINALAKTKIARTSNTPGRTQLVNFFQENNKYFVDLPGYGYARMSKQQQHTMLAMIEEYMSERLQLVKVFLLIDTKVGPTKDDLAIIDFLQTQNKDFMIVLTKADKPNQSQAHKTITNLQKLEIDFIKTSATNKLNIDKLRKIIELVF